MNKILGRTLIPYKGNEEIIKGYIELRRMIIMNTFDQELFNEVVSVVEI